MSVRTARPPFPPRLLLPLLPLLCASLLAACSKPAPPAADVRPVRAITLAAGKIDASTEFSGDVRPRYESRLGFRVGGKISARKVDVGTVVKRGTLLMQLDPQDLRLGQAQAQAALRAAETSSELAQAELKRYQGLRAQNFVSQAVLDEKVAAARSSQSTVESNRAALREQSNQTGYASLVSDTDGVVTAIDAEVGQVVAAGTPVVRVARTDDKEVVIGVPEDQVAQLRKVSEVKVKLWADPSRSLPGQIREVSPMADAATRTYTVKVTVPARDDVRLGMTAAVQLVHRSAGNDAALRVPLSALYQGGEKDRGATSVWVIENGAVKLVPVQVGGVAGNEVVLAGGVQAGQVVVTAGVNLLKNGQKVKVLTADVARRGDAEAEAVGKGEAKPAKAAPAPAAEKTDGKVDGAGKTDGAGGAAAAMPALAPVAGVAAGVAGAALLSDSAALAKAPPKEAAHAPKKAVKKAPSEKAKKLADKQEKKRAKREAKKVAAAKGREHHAKSTDKHGKKHVVASAGAAK